MCVRVGCLCVCACVGCVCVFARVGCACVRVGCVRSCGTYNCVGAPRANGARPGRPVSWSAEEVQLAARSRRGCGRPSRPSQGSRTSPPGADSPVTPTG